MDDGEKTNYRPGDFTADQRRDAERLAREWRRWGREGRQPQAALRATVKHVAGKNNAPPRSNLIPARRRPGARSSGSLLNDRRAGPAFPFCRSAALWQAARPGYTPLN